MTTCANINLQDGASPIIEQLIYFHYHALIIIIIILTMLFPTQTGNSIE